MVLNEIRLECTVAMMKLMFRVRTGKKITKFSFGEVNEKKNYMYISTACHRFFRPGLNLSLVL